MFRILAIMAVLAVLGVFGRAALMPSRLAVERSLVVEASAKQVMPFLEDFHSWGAWLPLERQNVDLSTRFAGAATGIGAVYSWSTAGGDNSGRMEIVALQPNAMVGVRVDQTAPDSGTAMLEFRLAPEAAATRLTIRFDQQLSLWDRLRSPLGTDRAPIEGNLDAMLLNLKLAVEAA